MKGIILAGGKATRLYPLTEVLSKQLLPVYDKPMIYYPLATLMQAGVRDIMVITNPENQAAYRRLLRRSHQRWGVRIQIVSQDEPQGIAQAITIAADYAFWPKGEHCFLVLGDNMFHGLTPSLFDKAELFGATIYLACVRDPQRYGVAEFVNNTIVKIHEKPAQPSSTYAVTGLYCYDDTAPDMVRNMTPSARGELEITDLNNLYLAEKRLAYYKLPASAAWLDAGTPDALCEASQYVRAVQHRTTSLVGSPELTALWQGWVTLENITLEFQSREDAYARSVLAALTPALAT